MFTNLAIPNWGTTLWDTLFFYGEISPDKVKSAEVEIFLKCYPLVN